MRVLCDFVSDHNLEEAKSNATKQAYWQDAADALKRECGGASRHWRQVRKKWRDLSYRAKLSKRKGELNAFI